ncbi:MAG: hypothetical protein A2V93_02505 [Ignavibacteria bacterium RBG_16_34_14]|nr:MAG: hypothetical protein A2V93_02505 [Ignavibacteria bacterium RBG_16_34_14]
MRRFILKILALIFILYINAVYPQGRTIGIFVDGGYSPGKKDTEMDKMLDKRIKDAMEIMKEKDKDSDTSKIEHKDDLIKKLESLHCGCGDEIVLYMVGHGEGTGGKSSYAFHFTKDDGSRITPDELRKALGKAADTCCCKISVVIFSCHSGSFLNTLFEDSHVVSVFVSSSETELSYSDAYRKDGAFIDGGDWVKSFNEDWKKSKAKNMVDGLVESAESAKEKMPDKFGPIEHPQGWVRGEFEIFGHVEKREKTGTPPKISKLWIHFYNPDFLRCTTREVKVDGINVPDSIDECSWVRFTVKTGKPKEPIIGISDVTATEPPVEKILAHILEVYKDGIKVHVVSPKWLYCNNIIIKVEKPGKIDPDLEPCNWTEINIKVIDPPDKDKKGDGKFSTTDTIKAKDQTFNCRIHVDRLMKSQNKMDIHILDPPWLNCKRYMDVLIPEDEREKMNSFDKCSTLVMDITFHPNGTIGIKNISLVTNAEGAKRFSLDAAIHGIQQLNIDTSNVFYPKVSLTNAGEETISFPVFVAVAKINELNLIQQWWQTGEGTPQCLWYDVVEVIDLPAAETRTIDFTPWQVSGDEDKYWVGFRTVLEGDENPASDTTSSILIVRSSVQNSHPQLINPFIQPLEGTIQTPFAFRVVYIDADGDEPVIHNAVIDGEEHQLYPGYGPVEQGREYYLQTNLSPGAHSFYFYFDDGFGHSVQSDVLNGPIVR